ncbi:MAG: hypothetical protein R3237_03985 [Nitrosopumilaceae archaeon]|nr:hypothetical protein [Nitrosopumilaceae archaeon]
MSSTENKNKKGGVSKPNESSDVYQIFQKSIDNYFQEVIKNAATYLQATSNLQQEIFNSRKKNAENAFTLQKAVFEKLDGNPKVPESAIDLAKSFVSETTVSWNLQNKIILESLDALSKNIEAFNKNSIAFEEINKGLIDYWSSIIKQASKISS